MQPAHVAYTAMIWSWFANLVPHLLTATIILVVGHLLAAWISQAVRKTLARTARLDPTVQPVIAAVVRYSILALAMVAALGNLGVQTASLLAVLSTGEFRWHFCFCS
jgi:small conductance mechanosensitive channel